MRSPLLGRAPWRIAVDLACVAALLLVGIIGFARTFSGFDYLIAGIAGIVLGLGIAFVGARFRLALLPVAALTIVVYFLFGTAAVFRSEGIAAVIPSLDSLEGLLFGAVTSWKNLLTSDAPVSGFPELLLVPYICALIAAVVAGSIALRSATRFVWALMPALVLLIASIVFGTWEPAAPAVQAVLFGSVAVAWTAWRKAELRADASRATTHEASLTDSASARTLTLRRLSMGAVLLIAASAIAFTSAGTLVPQAHRDTIRDNVVPPLDLHDYPSPLASYRTLVRDKKDAVLLTVDGLPEGARVRLATMDEYNGVVFNVSGDGGAGSGSFARLGREVADDRAGTPASLHFTTGELSGVWVPDAGYLTAMRFEGDRAAELERSAHYNPVTGVAVVTAGLKAGDSYTADIVLPPSVDDAALDGAAAAKFAMPAPVNAPKTLSETTTEATGDSASVIGQLRSMEAYFSQNGFFSHGLEGEVISRPGHGSERLESMLISDQMIGDDEQYAATMALMAEQLGLPARVVMGFYPAEGADVTAPVDIHGSDLHAWVEVAIDGAGWVTFDPTPPQDQVPQEQIPQPKTKPKALVLQPPPPPQEPADIPPDEPQEDEAADDPAIDLSWIGTVLQIASVALAAALIVLGPAIAIGYLKARRRRGRLASDRGADRIAGGWNEVIDHATDLGTPIERGATRREDARVLETAYPEAGVLTLARRADADVFGPRDPSDADVAAYWQQVDEIVAGMAGSVGWFARLRARLSLRSLLKNRRTGGRAR